ncbi:hypothetical protein CK203_002354 [Vitis vinifera]|uniref:Uncharacterized protein n=1 Tax=Vitis vinifera TaxID=29760 RepID=A0A438KKB6_VITVI|nr:hypothetical protein CK203_002354 [Vitis vinifera]
MMRIFGCFICNSSHWVKDCLKKKLNALMVGDDDSEPKALSQWDKPQLCCHYRGNRVSLKLSKDDNKLKVVQYLRAGDKWHCQRHVNSVRPILLYAWIEQGSKDEQIIEGKNALYHAVPLSDVSTRVGGIEEATNRVIGYRLDLAFMSTKWCTRVILEEARRIIENFGNGLKCSLGVGVHDSKLVMVARGATMTYGGTWLPLVKIINWVGLYMDQNSNTSHELREGLTPRKVAKHMDQERA